MSERTVRAGILAMRSPDCRVTRAQKRGKLRSANVNHCYRLAAEGIMSTVLSRLRIVAACGVVAVLMFAPRVEARITRIQITSARVADLRRLFVAGRRAVRKDRRQGIRRGRSPDPKNSVIVDILLAPRNTRGNVEYSFDFYILKPIDLTKGAHKVMYEPPNRGGKTWAALGRVKAARRQRPGLDHQCGGARQCVPDAARLHDGVERMGQGSARTAGPAGFVSTITLPIAKNPDGCSITGPAYEYIVTAGAPRTRSTIRPRRWTRRRRG